MRIKRIHNTVDNIISRLDSGPIQNDKANWMMFMKCWCRYTMNATNAENTNNHQEHIDMVFANCSNKDVIYPFTAKEIAQAQRDNTVLKKLSKHDKYTTRLVEDTQLLCKDGKVAIPIDL